MSYVIDAKWLVLVPIGFTAIFMCWVFWNLAREIWVERRRYVRRHQEIPDKFHRTGTRP